MFSEQLALERKEAMKKLESQQEMIMKLSAENLSLAEELLVR